MQETRIRPLESTDLADAATLLTQLNPETPTATIAARLHSMLANFSHYQFIGAFAGDTLVGVAGAWVATKIWCGLYLEIDNLVVAPGQRSAGIGSLLIRHLEALARERGCNIIVLDSYTANHPSHRLYHRLGFEIWGFHFAKPVGDWKAAP